MLLEARNIRFRYSKHEPWIFENFSISISQGEKLCLFAPSGYGKTTLGLLLSGYLVPENGEIVLDDASLPKGGICPVQLIHQHPEKAINPRWKLKRVLEECGAIDMKSLCDFGIEEAWLNRYPHELSGGELQRFCVARAMMAQPGFLICDEISTMLDTISQAQIWRIILSEVEKKNIGLISITHNFHLARRISDRIFDLSENKYI